MSTWLRHPVRAARCWLGGFIVDRTFLSADQQREIAAGNDCAAKEAEAGA